MPATTDASRPHRPTVNVSATLLGPGSSLASEDFRKFPYPVVSLIYSGEEGEPGCRVRTRKMGDFAPSNENHVERARLGLLPFTDISETGLQSTSVGTHPCGLR